LRSRADFLRKIIIEAFIANQARLAITGGWVMETKVVNEEEIALFPRYGDSKKYWLLKR
jgi:hypothetical protein